MDIAMTHANSEVSEEDGSTRVFEVAAELFTVLSTPMRLRILSAVCEQEKSVSQLLAEINTTQPNLSQHLMVLYRAGVLAKRKEGTQVFYRVQSEKAVQLCRSVCTQIAIELEEQLQGKNLQPSRDRLLHLVVS
jgi:DNA-binding transcriptional ArsR family regulator